MAVRLPFIVVELNAIPLRVVNRENGIERRTKLPGVDIQVVSLALLRGELEEIDVALLLDNAIESSRKIFRAGSGGGVLVIIIRLALQDVRKRNCTDQVR